MAIAMVLLAECKRTQYLLLIVMKVVGDRTTQMNTGN
jgi:hypothetical protein